MLIYRGKLDWFHYAPNEAFTLIILTSVQVDEPILAYWQWAVNANGDVQAPVKAFGLINSLTLTDSETNFGFMHDQYYKFDAKLVGTGGEKLEVTMRNPSGAKSNLMTLQLSYKIREGLPKSIGCSVYIGKLNWLKYADNEMITIVVPNSLQKGAPICAYWQWTQDSKGRKKSNCDMFGTIDDISDGVTIQFFQGQYYKFSGTVAEDKGSMSLTMTNPSDYRSTIALHLSHSNSSMSQLKRLTFTTESIVRNDKREAFICSLRDSGSKIDGKNILLSAIGFLIAGAGIVGLLPAYRTGAGAGVAVSSLAFTFSVGVGALQGSQDPDTTMLMPNRVIKRKATRNVFPWVPDNDVTITKFTIENSSTLVMYTYTKTNLGSGETTLSSLLPTDITWEKLLQITLPESRAQKLEVCAIVRIEGFTPFASGSLEEFSRKDLARMPAGTMYSTTKGATDQRFYGVWDQTKLKFDSSRTFFFLESTLSGPTAAPNKVMQIKGTDTVVWVLNKFWVNPNGGPSGTPLGSVQNESDAQDVITEKPGYMAYAWGGHNGDAVLGYKHDQRYTVEVGQNNAGSYVYIVIKQADPFLRIVYA